MIEEGIAKNGAMFQVFSNGLFNAKQTSSTIFDLTTPSVEFAKNNNKLLQDHHVPFKWSEDGTGIDMENWNSGLAEILNDWVKQEMMLPRWTGVPIKLNSDDGPNGAFGFSFTSGIFLPVGSEDLHEKLVMFFQLQYRKALLDATYAGASQLFLSQFNTPNEQVAKAAKDGLRVALRTFKGTKHPMTVYIPSQMQ